MVLFYHVLEMIVTFFYIYILERLIQRLRTLPNAREGESCTHFVGLRNVESGPGEERSKEPGPIFGGD